MTTLLERAKLIKPRNRQTHKLTEEDAELAIAWLKGDIQLSQISKVVGAKNGNASYSYLALALSKAYELGLIK